MTRMPRIVVLGFAACCLSAVWCDTAFAQAEPASSAGAASEPIALKIEPPFAWNRTDRYEPPNFAGFFPDDAEAGKQLDRMLAGKLTPASIDERLALVRRGLRNTSHHATTLLGAIGNEFVWNRKQQDPRAIELLYHASDAAGELAHFALYHGPTVVSDRSPNLIRMLMERYQSFDEQIQGRIVWGMKTYGDKEGTRKLLLALLDDHEKLDAATVGAALDVYQAVFAEAPPDLERFKNVGKWVVAYHHSDLSASHPRAATILRDELDKPYFRNGGLQLVDFVTRVNDGHEVAVALVQGVASRDTLTKYLSDRVHARVDFVEMLSPRTLQMRRLREFAKYLPEGTVKSARPSYTRPAADATYAFSASEFVAPDFAAFFADDAAAAAKLDAAFADRESITLSDHELLELFRRGVRRSAHKPNAMFGWISGALGWPGDPLLTEILYQGMDPRAPLEFRNAAVYYGFGLGTPKTKNILEALFQVYMAPPFDRTTNGNTRSRILWGVRDHEDDKHYLATRFAAALQDHAALSDEALMQADAAYRQLADMEPPNAAEYASRGVFIVLFEGDRDRSAEDAKEQIAQRLGESQHLLAIKLIDAEGHRTAVVLVRGAAGKKWLLDKLQAAPQVPIQFVDLLTREFIDAAKVEGKDVLRDLEQYVPAAR